MKIKKQMRGFIFIVAGIIIFIAAVGKFLLQIVGILIALLLINLGLQYYGLPSLLLLLQQWLDSLNIRFFKR